jgi:hypothetical protein
MQGRHRTLAALLLCTALGTVERSLLAAVGALPEGAALHGLLRLLA